MSQGPDRRPTINCLLIDFGPARKRGLDIIGVELLVWFEGIEPAALHVSNLINQDIAHRAQFAAVATLAQLILLDDTWSDGMALPLARLRLWSPEARATLHVDPATGLQSVELHVFTGGGGGGMISHNTAHAGRSSLRFCRPAK